MNSKLKKQKLVTKLTKKDYRHAWVEESIKMLLPYQIQTNREKRDWSQAILGREADMKQNAISRLESMDYGNLTINTLLRLAYGFDCGLLVKLVPFSRLVGEFEDVSPKGLEVESFDDDRHKLHKWIQGVERGPKKTPSRFQHLSTAQPSLFDHTENIAIESDDQERTSIYTGVEFLYRPDVQDFTGVRAN